MHILEKRRAQNKEFRMHFFSDCLFIISLSQSL